MAKKAEKKSLGGRKWFDGKNEAEVIAKLESCWVAGASDKIAADFAEIPASTLCRYLQSHPSIEQRKEALKSKPILQALTVLNGAIAGGDGNLALKLLERRCKQEFSTLQEVKSDVHLETTDPETEGLKNDIAGINAAIAREIAEIEKLQKAIGDKRGK